MNIHICMLCVMVNEECGGRLQSAHESYYTKSHDVYTGIEAFVERVGLFQNWGLHQIIVDAIITIIS